MATRKAHKFFDSYPRGEHRPADFSAHNGSRRSTVEWEDLPHLYIPDTNTIDYAHYGYLYCMAIVPSTKLGQNDGSLKDHEGVRLVTGSGDETVKVSYAAMLLHYKQRLTMCSIGIIAQRGPRCYIFLNAYKAPFSRLWRAIDSCTLVVKTEWLKYGISKLKPLLEQSLCKRCRNLLFQWRKTMLTVVLPLFRALLYCR
jgi:hypothetical protein